MFCCPFFYWLLQTYSFTQLSCCTLALSDPMVLNPRQRGEIEPQKSLTKGNSHKPCSLSVLGKLKSCWPPSAFCSCEAVMQDKNRNAFILRLGLCWVIGRGSYISLNAEGAEMWNYGHERRWVWIGWDNELMISPFPLFFRTTWIGLKLLWNSIGAFFTLKFQSYIFILGLVYSASLSSQIHFGISTFDCCSTSHLIT